MMDGGSDHARRQGEQGRAWQIVAASRMGVAVSGVLTAALLGAALLLAPIAEAGPIERACLRSDRQASSRQLCACIDAAADRTLRSGDQRRAAKFFRDPDLAHRTWMSKRGADDVFWDRYKAFGAQAEAICAGR